MNSTFLRRLEAAERAAANLPKAGAIPPELHEFLAGLSTEQLEAVEAFAAMLEFGPPHTLRPAETLTDAEAVAEWRRLCARPELGIRP